MIKARSAFITSMLLIGNFCAALAAENIKPLELGSKCPDFNLPSVDGRAYSLKDFSEARVLVIIFTCNHCPTAQIYEDRIKQLYDQYHDKGVALVAISPNDPAAVRPDELGYTDLSDSLEEMKMRAAQHGFKFPYLYDGETQKFSRSMGVLATPHVFIFDKAGILRYAGAMMIQRTSARSN